MGPSAGAASYVINEVPTGAVDGVNTVFTTAQPFLAGSTEVRRDGQHMAPTGDYVETDSTTITFVTAPVVGSALLVSYLLSVPAAGNADTLDGYHAGNEPGKIPVLDGAGKLSATLLPEPFSLTMLRNYSSSGEIAVAAPAWTDFLSTSFNTEAISGYVMITVRGYIQATAAGYLKTRLLVDGVVYPLGTCYASGENGLAGASPIFIGGLTTGTHSLVLQVLGPGTVLCRQSAGERVDIQVMRM
jgi:hypothetical protein